MWGFYAESEQPGCAQSQEISTSDFASEQRWLQYFLSFGTVHLQAGCEHFLRSVLAMRFSYESTVHESRQSHIVEPIWRSRNVSRRMDTAFGQLTRGGQPAGRNQSKPEPVETGTGPGCVELPWRSASGGGSMPKAIGEAQGKISGRIIIEQLIRNMELGQFEMGYSILTPCIFSLYLHPDDYTRLTGVFDLIREDAKTGAGGQAGAMNAKPLGLGALRGAKDRKPYKIAVQGLGLRIFSRFRGRGAVGRRGDSLRAERDAAAGLSRDQDHAAGSRAERGRDHRYGQARRPETRQSGDRVYAEIRYEDDSGPQLYLMTQDEISVGRGRRWRAGQPGAVHQRRSLARAFACAARSRRRSAS